MLNTSMRACLHVLENRLLTIIIFFLACAPIYAKETPSTSNSFDEFIKNTEKEAAKIQGGAISIIAGKEVIYKKTFGLTKANGTPIDEDTIFTLASVSKPIVANGIGLYVDKKLLSFEDKIKLKCLKTPVSIANFLSHTTGYHIRGDKEIESSATDRDIVEFIRKQKPNTEPDKSYTYSNCMFDLVRSALEAKGLPFTGVIKTLNDALGIEAIAQLPIKQANVASPHSRKKKELSFPSKYQLFSPSSAGLLASVNGMTEFMQLAMGNKPEAISQATLGLLYKPVVKAPDVYYWTILPFDKERIQSWYCLGWRLFYLDNDPDSALIFHAGFLNGATPFIGFMPTRKIGIVILNNQTSKFAITAGMNFWKTIIENDLRY